MHCVNIFVSTSAGFEIVIVSDAPNLSRYTAILLSIFCSRKMTTLIETLELVDRVAAGT